MSRAAVEARIRPLALRHSHLSYGHLPAIFSHDDHLVPGDSQWFAERIRQAPRR